VVYAGLCGVLWIVPVFDRLQVESAATIAGVGFITAGLIALASFRNGTPFGRELWRQLAILFVPLVLMSLAAAWAPNCTYGQGLAFFGLFVVPSVGLAVALAWGVAASPLRHKKGAFVAVGFLLALVPVVYDLGFHPQFYTYNPVFGGILGPIYDEELTIRSGLIVHRGMTLLLAALAYLTGEAFRGVRRPMALAVVGAVWLAGFLGAPRLGIVATPAQLAWALGNVATTDHFEIHYDSASVTSSDLRAIAEDHEFRYAVLARRLGVEVPGRIATYLYPDADTRARLTGARYTNVAPVWLRRPQMHLLLDAYSDVFSHELAHVFSREFGVPGLRVSLSVGLVEGFAEAMEAPAGRPTLHEQVLAAATSAGASEEAPLALSADALAGRLSPLGFWTGRGAVSYAMMGSFVAYLIEAYGIDRFKRVYARADFERVYGKPIGALAQEWADLLRRLPSLHAGTRVYVARRFSRPSLFEQECPHHLPTHERRYREAEDALADGDTLAAEQALAESLSRAPRFEPAQNLWADLHLARGEASSVLERYSALVVHPLHAAADTVGVALRLVLADALAIEGRVAEARKLYESIRRAVPAFLGAEQAGLAARIILADRPDAIGALRAGSPAAQQQALDAVSDSSVALDLVRASVLAAGERFDEAADRLAAVSARTLDPSIERYARMGEAYFLYRAGRLDDASAAVEQALATARRDGALPEIQRLADISAKMQYLRRSPVALTVGAAP
jgi:tetratricopeptide (TPR) repeat protein